MNRAELATAIAEHGGVNPEAVDRVLDGLDAVLSIWPSVRRSCAGPACSAWTSSSARVGPDATRRPAKR